MLQHACLVGCLGLGGEDDLLALGAQGRAHHALVVAVLVVAGGVEVVDAEICGALNDAGVGGDHAAEPNGGDLEAGAAEGLVGELDRASLRERRFQRS